MDSVIYPGTDKLWPTRVSDPPPSSASVDLTSQKELYQRTQGTCGYEPQPSSLSKEEMNWKDVPVVDNSFSLPQNVFERVLASQTAVSIVNNSAGQQQRKRTSGYYVTELTGTEAKRPRLSSSITSEQDLAHRRHNKQLEREQFKLQILRRLDHTKSNILKLLKVRHMQNLVHYYENNPLSNHGDKFGSPQRNEHRCHSQRGSAYKTQYQTPTLAPVQDDPRPVSVSPKTQGISRSSHLHSSSHSFRHVPEISIVADQWKEQRTKYYYKSSDSVGLAWDHKTLPKIVAVHSVSNDANASSKKTLNHPTARNTVDCANHTREKSEVRQNQSQTPVISPTSEINDRATAVTDRRYSHEDDEVVVTNVLPKKPRCTINAEQQRAQTTTSNHRERLADKRESSPNDLQVKRNNLARAALDTSYKNMEEVRGQDDVHTGFLQYPEHADSEVYLGGPPPYLPVLDSSEMAEQEKERRSPPETEGRRGSNSSSPRLSKTIPEIKEKLRETRERMKKETIEWKKKILYKLEKRLIIKLRRAESSTGQRIEIEDLPEEGEDKGKKHGSPCHDRRGSNADSVTDSVTDDNDTPEHTPNLSEESDNEHRKCRQEDKKGRDTVMEVKIKYEEVQNEFPCTEEEITEHGKIPAGLIKEEKVERFCNSFEEPLNADEGESNVKSDENLGKEDCVKNEYCNEVKFHIKEETRSGNETSRSLSANAVQRDHTETTITNEVSESRRVRSLQQSNDLITECVTLAGNANERPKEGNKNLFEAFSCGFQAPALKTDKPQLPENTEQAPIITNQGMSSSSTETKKDEPAETKKLVQKNEKLLKNLSSLKERLQTCSKEVLKKKTDTVRCDRNIWSVLERNGIS